MKIRHVFLHAAVLGSAAIIHAASDAPPADIVPFAGLTAKEACTKATLPPGFKMHVFAAEPDVRQPIAFCLDHRGRVWVAEGCTYPVREGQPPKEDRTTDTDRAKPSAAQLKDIFGGADRILILEDTDGDHQFDRKTVFLENLNLVSGVEVGFGGVWIGAAPYLLFVPVKDWDSPKPAGEPQILLDGWNYADTHETLNTFTWGPDGWLYGCQGVGCTSRVGKPGAPRSERQWMDCGVWRYHPVRHVFEAFSDGGSNPWGIDFDEHGQLWAEMCVLPHLWHIIQGARYERQAGEHFALNAEETHRYSTGSGRPVHPHIFGDIKQTADHLHWAGQGTPHDASGRSDAVGGGHAHAGLMCYLGTSWPAEYRGELFIGNIHGHRLNVDIPARRGSGYVGRHGKDFLNFNDSWSETLNQLYDQDGSVFIIDWYDKNRCHNNRKDGFDRSNGRIYKIVYQEQKPTRVNLATLGEADLVKLVPSKNEFLSRHARRVLQERAEVSRPQPATTEALRKLVREGADTAARLRALWALHVTSGTDARTEIENLRSPDEWLRAWTIQLAFESQANFERLIREANELGLKTDPDLQELAKSDPSPLVRLFLASAAQRASDPAFRAGLVKRLLAHSEDAADHNLPLMCWFAMDRFVAEFPAEALTLALDTRLPQILNFTTRHIAATGTAEARDLLTEKLAALDDPAKQREMLAGLDAALKGQRSASMPKGWAAVEAKLGSSPSAEVRTLTESISLIFGSQRALAALRKTLADPVAPVAARQAALDSLAGIKDAGLPAELRSLLHDAALRGPALRSLAGYGDEKTTGTILEVYASLDGSQKRDALTTLASRSAFAQPLLAAVEAGKVPRADLTADVIRQLRGLKDPAIQEQMTKLYGAVREPSADKRAEIERYLRLYWAGGSQPGEAPRGRVVFNKICAQCHTLYGTGGKVGPDITGANRKDVHYLFETILDPNAVIPNEYRASEVETQDGRSLSGIVKSQDDKTVTLQTANELLTLPRNEIASQRLTELSMMPEGLLSPLDDQEMRDLIYYLTRPGQVSLPPDNSAK